MNAAGISVYPNPVLDVLTLEFKNAVNKNTMVSIYNSIGEVVLSKQIHTMKSEISFDLPAGIYSVEIKTADGVYISKVIKL
jgi:hypothetical protein